MKSKEYLVNEKFNQAHRLAKRFVCALCLLIGGLVAASEVRAATITVDRTDDTAAASACTASANDCSLRGAFAFANANSGTVINIPAGTYNLTIDELQVGTATNVSTTITGAGANVTTINQTVANRRVIDLNPSLAANVVVNISGVRITGGNSPSDNFGGGGLIGGGPGNIVNLTDCIFENNSDVNAATAKGGAVEFAGGGVLDISNCTFNNNTAGGAALGKGVGGAVDFQLLNNAGAAGQGGLVITDSTFTNNRAGAPNSGAGGAVRVAVTTTQTPRTVIIMNNTFTGNQANAATANGFGGALTSSSASALTVKFNRITGNTATGGASGMYQTTGSTGTIDATQNWWGCSAGPGNAGCDSIGGVTANITSNPRIVLSHTPNTNPIVTGQATVLTASFLRDSANNALTTANISELIGLPITFNNAVRGSLSAAQTTIQASGTATANFTAASAGAGSADAIVDNQTATASITINKANTAITMNTDTPDPTVVGQSYTASFNAPTVTAPGAGTPTGTVTISDGTNNCTATLPALSCNLTSTSPGTKNLTATYNGDANFNASAPSPSIPHTVNKANTTAAITADTPDPSVVGQSYAVTANVSVNSPGAGTPTGTITVSDGTQNCTITLPATSCNLTSTTAGAKTLTATYNGDANFNASPVSAGVSHTVNKANTTATITADTPDPSTAGQNVTVSFSVSVNSPGAGTPTGNVTVTDGVDSCTGTVAAGQCTIVLNTVGSRTLTATYQGDANFNASPVSAGVSHQVNAPCTPNPVVTNINDSGAGSLRQAITDACVGGTITFSALFNTPQIITLTSGELAITKNLTVTGAGANLLTVSGNNASRVFFISNATVTISGISVINGNGVGSTSGFGGGVFVLGGTTTINDSVFRNNSASTGGGIAQGFATLNVNRTTVSSNTANEAGGIYSQDGSLTVRDSTISGNSGSQGEGVRNRAAAANGTATLINTTISGNTSTNQNSAFRSEVANNFTSTVNLINCTITNNSTTNAGGNGALWLRPGTGTHNVTLTNTIVSGNLSGGAPFDIEGTLNTASSFSLIGTGGNLTNGVNANQVGVNNPMLAALANNGGATQTHALTAGSPAIDKGGAAVVPFAETLLPPLTTDQRGAMRPVDLAGFPNAPGGDGSDIGAFEIQAPTAANVSVAGRVLTADGAGLQNAIVVMTDANGAARQVRTGSFGYYRFDGVAVGQTYVFQVISKRFTFAPQIVTINEELSELNFVANE